MSEERTVHEKLEYLVRATGRKEADVIAEALEEGLAEIYREQITSAYLSGVINRDEAVNRLGEKSICDLDYARDAITQDVKWGLKIE